MIKSEHKINVLDPDPNDEEGWWRLPVIPRLADCGIKCGLMPQEIGSPDKAYYNQPSPSAQCSRRQCHAAPDTAHSQSATCTMR